MLSLLFSHSARYSMRTECCGYIKLWRFSWELRVVFHSLEWTGNRGQINIFLDDNILCNSQAKTTMATVINPNPNNYVTANQSFSSSRVKEPFSVSNCFCIELKQMYVCIWQEMNRISLALLYIEHIYFSPRQLFSPIISIIIRFFFFFFFSMANQIFHYSYSVNIINHFCYFRMKTLVTAIDKWTGSWKSFH